MAPWYHSEQDPWHPCTAWRSVAARRVRSGAVGRGRLRVAASGIIRGMPEDDAALSVPPRAELRRRVLAGEPTIGLFLNLGSIVSTEIVARAGYDWALVDLEHGMATEGELLGQLIAIQSTPTAAIVRVV